MELTSTEIIELSTMKIELISNRRVCLLSDLKLGNVFFQNKKFSGKNGYFISYNDKLLLGYRGKFSLGFPNHFTTIDDVEIYQPHIFRQLNGKYKDNLVYFPFYEAWKEYYNCIDALRNSSDKRIFLHSYLNNNITL